jgi:hypothetical protein
VSHVAPVPLTRACDQHRGWSGCGFSRGDVTSRRWPRAMAATWSWASRRCARAPATRTYRRGFAVTMRTVPPRTT